MEQNRNVGKQAHGPGSPFWQNLVKAWGRQGLPTSQNGIAKKLRRDGKPMSQGSVRRWFTGDGYPEIPQLIQIARLGKCSIHWLLTSEGPETLVFDAETTELLRNWSELHPDSRTALLRAARLEHVAMLPGNHTPHSGLQNHLRVVPPPPAGKNKK